METKKQIRNEILAKRDSLSKAEIEEKSEQITHRVAVMPAFQKAEQILAFVSFGSEVNTRALIEEAWKLHKKVFCPLVEGDTMNFYEITDFGQLREGYKGILEPAPGQQRLYVCRQGDLMLMPGAVFDRDGNRIGYGKGFYDRFLAGGFPGTRIAICLSLQFVTKGRIPASETDIRPDFIVSEEETVQI